MEIHTNEISGMADDLREFIDHCEAEGMRVEHAPGVFFGMLTHRVRAYFGEQWIHFILEAHPRYFARDIAAARLELADFLVRVRAA